MITRPIKPDEKVIMKTIADIGFLMRGAVIRELKSACWRTDTELEIEEAKGFLESTYKLKLTGTYNNLIQIKNWLENIAS